MRLDVAVAYDRRSETGGNRLFAAQALGIGKTTICRKLNEQGLEELLVPPAGKQAAPSSS